MKVGGEGSVEDRSDYFPLIMSNCNSETLSSFFVFQVLSNNPRFFFIPNC